MPPQLVLVTRMPQKSSKSQAKTNQNGKKYLEYEAMGKEELVQLLRKVHARIKMVEKEVEELRQILLYGSVQADSSTSSSPGAGYTRGRSGGGYTRGRSYGYRRAGKKPAQAGEEKEEPVGEEEEVEEAVEEGPKPKEKPAEAKAEDKPEKGGS